MYFDISDRGEGKTTRLVDWWLEAPGQNIIVVPNQDQFREVAGLIASRLQTSIPSILSTYPSSVVSMSQFLTGALDGQRDIQIGFDNLDMCLRSITQHRVVRATARQDGG